MKKLFPPAFGLTLLLVAGCGEEPSAPRKAPPPGTAPESTKPQAEQSQDATPVADEGGDQGDTQTTGATGPTQPAPRGNPPAPKSPEPTPVADSGTKPVDEPAAEPPLPPSKLGWNGETFVGSAELALLPLE